MRVAINGFGRIGRCVFKIMQDLKDVEIVAVNDLADLGDLAYLLKYDSVHGWYRPKVDVDGDNFVVDGHKVHFYSARNPEELPWKELGVDVVLEATGAFRKRVEAARHLEAGARKVVISAPSEDADGMFVLGVNSDQYDPEKHHVVSMASCTTNCLAPVAKVVHENFGVESLVFTTVHAYTSSQALMDTPVRKRRRGRAAATSIIPTSTGAAAAAGVVIPELDGKMSGAAMRVPVPDGSVTDMTFHLSKETTAGAINDALSAAAESDRFRGILRVTDEALVSRDILGDPHSSIVDSELTDVLMGKVAKVVSWYDNEWGYSSRLADFSRMIAG